MKKPTTTSARRARGRWVLPMLWGVAAAMMVGGAAVFVVYLPSAMDVVVPLTAGEQAIFAPSAFWHSALTITSDAKEEGSTTTAAVTVATVPAGAAFVAVNQDNTWTSNVTRTSSSSPIITTTTIGGGSFWRRSATLTTGSHTTMQLVAATAPVDVFVIAADVAVVDTWLAAVLSDCTTAHNNSAAITKTTADRLGGTLLAQQQQTTCFNFTVSVPVASDGSSAARSKTFFFVLLFCDHQRQQEAMAMTTTTTTTVTVSFVSHRHVLRLDWLPMCSIPCTLALPFVSETAKAPFAVVQGGDACKDSACFVTATAPPRRAAWWLVIFLPIAGGTLVVTLGIALLRVEWIRRSMLRGSPLHRFSQLPQHDETEDLDDGGAQQMDPLDLDIEQTPPGDVVAVDGKPIAS